MRKVLAISVVFLGFAAAALYATANVSYPPLQDGDLIFQTSTSGQSSAILFATANFYTHMGIIKNDGKNAVVIEAAATVRETALADWVSRGVFRRVAIFRDVSLTPEQAKRVLSSAEGFYGKPYDIFFSLENDAIYCSELPYLAYKAAGIAIGKLQKISDLNIDNFLVKRLIARRWQRHAECALRQYDFEKCYNYILNQDVVTPASIANDNQFKKIYSNYPL